MMDAPPDRDMVIVGGPNSSLWTSIAWEFEGPNNDTLRRNPDPIIPLTYYGISDREGLERVGYLLDGEMPVATSNWPFVCTDERRPVPPLITPEYSAKEFLRVEHSGRVEMVPIVLDNYLLATRIPNFLAPNFEQIMQTSSREDWPYILVFEGTHGVGTRGVELLLTVKGLDVLDKLRISLNGANSFQAMFWMGDVMRTLGGFHKPNSIKLLDSVPMDLPDSVYLRAHTYAMGRFSAQRS
jgi:hypothetical protein